MKKTIFLLIIFCVLSVTKALAYTWTDTNGVTWEFSQKSYTINGTSQTLWTITNLSGYGEEVVFPSVVYNGTTACTVEAIGSSLLYDNKTVTSVTLPATIKYIGYGAFNFMGGMVTMLGTTPPVLGGSDTIHFGPGVTILVPSAAMSAYRNADVWSDYTVRIINKDVHHTYNISTMARSDNSGMVYGIDEEDFGNVMSLKVSGTINSYDIIVMRNKMHNLHYLDLTEAKIVANDYPYFQTLHTTNNHIGSRAFINMHKLISVKLPKSITAINGSAFYNCDGLKTVEFQDGLVSIGDSVFYSCGNLRSVSTKQGLKTIGRYAFSNCSYLKTVDIEECQSIGKYAFYSCSNLNTVNIEECQGIDEYAFSNCSSLSAISLAENLVSIGSGAFRGCSSLIGIAIPNGVTEIQNNTFLKCTKLAAVALPKKLKSIAGSGLDYEGAFYGCTSLTSISLPTSLNSIGNYAFKNCTSLAELHIPASMKSIGKSAFSGCTALKDIYTYTVEPTDIQQATFSCWTIATLHVPYFAYYNYYWDTQWSQFAFLDEFSDTYEYDYFYITKDFTFNDENGVVNGVPAADLNAGSGLVVNLTNQSLQLDEVRMAQNASTSASIIANNNLQVNKLYFDIAVTKNKWYFLSFPFRVKVANTSSPGDFVFRYYDGQTRATSGSGGWKNVTTTYLNAGQGYIYQTNTDGTLTLMVEKADMDFSGNTRNRTLNTYTATDTKNASWNLVGNMHPSYYDIAQTGYTAPITVWNGSSYVAKRAGDDQYSLSPFQAFFVQKPSNVNQMSFPAAGRYTKTQWDSYVASQQSSVKGLHAPEHSERAIVNLTIDNGEDVVDETRVVFNAAKSADYEMDCDAAKFMSDQPVPQLYTLCEDGTQYAINERPVGEVALCYVAPSDGELSIGAPRMDQPVYLQDNVLGITHDLSLGAYTFTTEAGTFEDRFTLMLYNPATGIDDMGDEMADGKSENSQWFDLQGRQHNGTHLPKGLYVIKSGAKATKVVKQ